MLDKDIQDRIDLYESILRSLSVKTYPKWIAQMFKDLLDDYKQQVGFNGGVLRIPIGSTVHTNVTKEGIELKITLPKDVVEKQ